MIITTLAAHFYNNEDNVFLALKNIATKLSGYSSLIEDRASQGLGDIIKRKPDGTWYIGNPVNRGENFADRWHEDNHARAIAFFEWVQWVSTDLIDIASNPDFDTIVDSVSAKLNKNRPSSKSQSTPAIISKPIIEIKNPIKPWCNSDK